MRSADVQRTAYLRAFQNVIQRNKLSHVAVVDFSWVANLPFEGSLLQDGASFPGKKNMKIKFSRNDPFAKVDEGDMLVVAMYAWDGNSFPGKTKQKCFKIVF